MGGRSYPARRTGEVIGTFRRARYRRTEGASYNGHFGSTCYHPLFVFNQFGDCEGAMLRDGERT